MSSLCSVCRAHTSFPLRAVDRFHPMALGCSEYSRGVCCRCCRSQTSSTGMRSSCASRRATCRAPPPSSKPSRRRTSRGGSGCSAPSCRSSRSARSSSTPSCGSSSSSRAAPACVAHCHAPACGRPAHCAPRSPAPPRVRAATSARDLAAGGAGEIAGPVRRRMCAALARRTTALLVALPAWPRVQLPRRRGRRTRPRRRPRRRRKRLRRSAVGRRAHGTNMRARMWSRCAAYNAVQRAALRATCRVQATLQR